MEVGTQVRAPGADEVAERGIETAVVTMRCTGGTLATLEASWLHPRGYDIRVEVLAGELAATAGLSSRTPIQHLDGEVGTTGSGWTGYLERFAVAYEHEMRLVLSPTMHEHAREASLLDHLMEGVTQGALIVLPH